MSEQQYVVKLQSPLSNKPFFVKITSPDMSMDHVLTDAIATLRNSGRPLEAQQLDQLAKQHSLFSQGKLIGKGDMVSDLLKQGMGKTQVVGTQAVNILEVDLVSAHSGGSFFSF